MEIRRPTTTASNHGASRRRRQRAWECQQQGRSERPTCPLSLRGASAAGWGKQPPVAGAAD